jgi:hydrogenase/urease accessory protein HupE
MEQFIAFFKEGFFHILDFNGADHILFLLAVSAIYKIHELKQLAWVSLSFTIAHSVTLALTLLDVISIPSEIVEFLIAATILFTCIENMFLKKLHPYRIIITGFFGLIHGMGFSTHLKELFMGMKFNVWETLLPFNLGLEAGQIIIITTLLLLLLMLQKVTQINQRAMIYLISLPVGIIAIYWLIERNIFS